MIDRALARRLLREANHQAWKGARIPTREHCDLLGAAQVLISWRDYGAAREHALKSLAMSVGNESPLYASAARGDAYITAFA